MLDTKAGAMETSQSLPPPPDYEYGSGDELASLSSTSSLPQYEDAVVASSPSGFHATHSYQVETVGHSWYRPPFLRSPEERISVYSVDNNSNSASAVPSSSSSSAPNYGEALYESVRQKRHLGSSLLYHVPTSTSQAVCETTYRLPPGRPPRMSLLGQDGNEDSNEDIEMTRQSLVSRAILIRTALGTFRWRYASRAERKEAGADNLLVMELVTTVALSSDPGGPTEQRGRRVAQLVRNAEMRSSGTGRTTAGNGGRLMADLRDWGDGKAQLRRMEDLVVASCLAMLKREIDRRKIHQAVAASGGGGGP